MALRRRRFRLVFVDEAADQLDALPDDVRTLVRREIAKLIVNPRHPDALAMWADWAGHWRVRAGVYRVIDQVHEPDRVVVVRIGPRGSVYAIR